MRIVEAASRAPNLTNRLLSVWESSVRATHLFLSDAEIEDIKKYVPQALDEVAHLVIAEDGENRPVAFMGIEDGTLEMLFVSAEERGKGFGKRLIEYGIENHAVTRLAVNEQNPQAKGFYGHMGFRVYKRTDFDEQGNPYPLLYMKLSRADRRVKPTSVQQHRTTTRTKGNQLHKLATDRIQRESASKSELDHKAPTGGACRLNTQPKTAINHCDPRWRP